MASRLLIEGPWQVPPIEVPAGPNRLNLAWKRFQGAGRTTSSIRTNPPEGMVEARGVEPLS